MRVTEASIRNPAAVVAALVLLAVFGVLAATGLPIQLFPDIERPQMSVQANWRAASPQEMEAEILEPMESVLQGLPGLERMDSNAGQGFAGVNLEFQVGTDMREMLVEVIGRLNRMRPLPPDANRPVVQLGSDMANQSLSWFFVQLLPDTPGPVEEYLPLVRERVVSRIEAVPGVAGVVVNGGPPEELHISVDLARAAALGIGLPDIAARAARADDVSGGQLEQGRRQVRLRFAGRYSPEEIGALVLAWRDGRPVYLSDVASVELRRPEQRFFVWQNGNPAIGLQVLRESGANVLATLEEVKAVVAELREGELARAGLGIEQSFDPSLFINRAIGLLSGNLLAGLALAVGVIWWFLRNRRTTLLVASAVPISLLGTFLALQLAGRSLNVISLAGLAFAVGMVMDAAVVVAENILRLRDRGLSPTEAAARGAAEVRGALVASTLTTVAVFVPVMFLGDVEGQLFADLAFTVSVAVAISLLVALVVLPAGAGGWLRPKAPAPAPTWQARTVELVMRATATRRRQLGWVAGLVVAPVLATVAMAPPLDYLPPVKRAAVDTFFSFPPGMSPATVDREIGSVIRDRMAPFMAGEREPALRNWYMLLWPGGGNMGARVLEEDELPALEQLTRSEVLRDLPDTRAFATIGELFGAFGGSARAIQIHVQSADQAALVAAAERGREQLGALFPGANVQAFPNVDAAEPELRLHPDDRRLAEAGWDRAALGQVVRAMGEGLWLGEYFDGERRVPMILDAQGHDDPAALDRAPVVTPGAGVLPLGELVRVERALAPAQLRRVDRRRTITLTVDPPADVPLDSAIARVREELLPAIRAELPPDGGVLVSGSADRLATVMSTMAGNFGLALLILAVLMAAMFRSVRDSLLVMLTLPMAVFGGVLGLRLLGLVAFQPLDLLSMIGFVMLLGMVVNNAILLVSCARNGQREGLGTAAALEAALSQRLRPILVCALTGALGALPMVLNPGPGSVIYRGLAAVTVGGVVFSLVFTLVLVPALMRLERGAAPLPAADASPALPAAGA